MKSIKIVVSEYDTITLEGPSFDTASDNGNAIVKYKKTYASTFRGEPYESFGKIEDYQPILPLHILNPGDMVGFIENVDWVENISEFSAEMEIKTKTKSYYDDENCGYAFFLMKDNVISLSGEYSVIEDKLLTKINKAFGKNYKAVFIG